MDQPQDPKVDGLPKQENDTPKQEDQTSQNNDKQDIDLVNFVSYSDDKSSGTHHYQSSVKKQ
ncbi:unnamed protein product [Clonostachys rosea f. rosea IK726]|uniref:Uncharacterized protein n=1 Tax=Clonostachys rosea f. rosea IK726 TaxID=1349383 RepID=A0ACA9TWV2_BIOOC|nr:unnamed protein product [Clonostachys rosea f. rosea IK726]